MKKLILILALAGSGLLNAQLDTSFTLLRNGYPAMFGYRKFSNLEQSKNFKGLDFPQYSFNETQFNRMKGLLDLFLKNEVEYNNLRRNFNQKDSIYKAQIAVYNQIDSIQGLRNKNFEQAYNSLVLVNNQYNQQLINCKDVAIRENRKSRMNTAMFGVLAGLTAGVILGVAIK